MGFDCEDNFLGEVTIGVQRNKEIRGRVTQREKARKAPESPHCNDRGVKPVGCGGSGGIHGEVGRA